MLHHNMLRRSAQAFALLAALACGKKDASPPAEAPAGAALAPPPAPTVSAIDLGRHLGSNSRATDTASTFGVRDTIYASVVTDHAVNGSSMIAKWTFQTGQLVDSTMSALARTDSSNTTVVTEFHISKKSAWPAGKYKVEFWLDGQSVGSRDFTIRK